MAISGLEAAYGHTSLKHDLPVAPYFVFGALALLSATGDVRMLVRGEVSGTNRIVRHLWRMSVAFFIAALRAATADTDIFDLLAVSHVVHKYVETQSDSCPAEYGPVINSIAFLSRTPFESAIPILVRASFACL
jgi:hypothetical protein